MKYLLLFLIVLFVQQSFSQNVLMEEDVSLYDIKKPGNGPNLRHFDHLYINYGFYADPTEGEGADIIYGKSHTLTVGYRYKLKVAEWLAVGTSLNYHYMTYHLKQNSTKLFPNNVLHEKESLKFNNLGTDLYLRLNFGHRGNVMGRFIDFAVYGNWAFTVKHFYEDKIPNALNIYRAKKIKVDNKGLNYVEMFNYGLKTRIGFNRYVIFVNYRTSDLFKSDFKAEVVDVELPRISVGFEIGLF